MSTALQAAQAAGADLIVAPFPDPIGVDAIIQWPGGINMQLYWHTKPPSYPAFQHVPENRVYVSPDRADAFTRSFLEFSHGKVVSDEARAPGIEIGTPNETIRIIRIDSLFGNMIVFVSKGFLPFPYGHETTGYELDHLDTILARGAPLGVTVLVPPYVADHRRSAVVRFPGGYIAELHEVSPVMRNLDDFAIRDLTARFADAINRRDREQFRRLWWDDGLWELSEPYPMTATGVVEVLGMYDRLMEGWAFFAQLGVS